MILESPRNVSADYAEKKTGLRKFSFGAKHRILEMFSTVVSQHNFWVNYGKGQPDEARFTRLLLERGADPNVRASIRAAPEKVTAAGRCENTAT